MRGLTITSRTQCFVLGCGEVPILSAVHKRFGTVASCGGHNPGRHGYALALAKVPGLVHPGGRPVGDGGNGPGSKVLAEIPKPGIPPMDGAAVRVPVGPQPVEAWADF